MADINNEIFVCLDCETTGLDAVSDRIIEVAVVQFTVHQNLMEFESLVDPQRSIPDESIAFHHITESMVAGQPTIEQVLPKLLPIIDKHPVVGHSVQFDLEILTNAAKRAGIQCNIDKNPTLDTLRLARHYGESPVNSLERLRQHFNIQPEGAHRAMNDVIVNMAVFKNLVKRFKTTEQLFELLSKPIELKMMPLGKYKGRRSAEIPLEFLFWASRQDYDLDLRFSIREELKRRRKGNLFTQATNPFNEL